MNSDWREPVKPQFFVASGVLVQQEGEDETHESLVMAFNQGDPAVDLLLAGEVCSNCAFRMPARPCAANLRLFEPISDFNYPYDDRTVRDLIRREQCPVCRAVVSPAVAERMLISDRWERNERGVIDEPKAREWDEADKQAAELELREWAERKARIS